MARMPPLELEERQMIPHNPLIPYDNPLTALLGQIQEVEPMGFQERAMKAYDGRISNIHTELLFKKTGEEIGKSLEGVVKKLSTKLEETKVSIAEICKRREIDPKEVIEAGSDEVAVNTYSMKAETSLGRGTSNTLIRELQEDLQNLRRYGMMVESYTTDITSYQRIQKHIEPKREFDLSFNELTNFGFGA